jgi:hypothetical protein
MIEAGTGYGAARVAPATPGNSAAPSAYTDFAAAINSALRDFHRPDLLARNPLLRGMLRDVGTAAWSTGIAGAAVADGRRTVRQPAR